MAEPRPFGSIEEFRKLAREAPKDKPIIDARVRSSFDTEIKIDSEKRTLTFAISTESVDRMGDTIAVDGWKLDAYRKNPVVLWAHDSSMLPVAKAPTVWIEGGKLKSTAEFTPAALVKFNDIVFEMYKGGFLSATSVGFNPLKYAFTDDPQRRFGIDFIEQELLEYSCCPVPANAEALIEGRSAGIDIQPILDWCGLALKRSGDASRVIALAEDVLGKGIDTVALPWARKIVAAAGDVMITPERAKKIAEAENAATRARIADRRKRDLDLIRLR